MSARESTGLGFVAKFGRYSNGSLALSLETLDGEPLATASVNLQEYGLLPPDGHIYVKNYSEGAGLAEALEQAGVAVPVGVVEFGPFSTTATLMRIREVEQ